MQTYLDADELYHHGIKGMKWGVRRFQRKDGSLTSAGKKRYLDDPSVKSSKAKMESDRAKQRLANAEYNKAYNKASYIPTKSNRQALNKAYADKIKADSEYRRSKFDYSTNKEAVRLRESGKEIKNKSKHRLKLEEQYKKMGLTDEQAQAAANKRIRTEKILAASAALTVTACAAYVANKKLKDRIDGVIKAGDQMQRISMTNNGGKLHDVFYAAKGDHDIKRYEGMLGATRSKQVGSAYKLKLEATRDIKVASKDHAAKIFEDLYKNDKEFRDSAIRYARINVQGKNAVLDLSKSDARTMKKMYENFNSHLVNMRNDPSKVDQAFYDKLKKAGYGAIQDINDMKFSGYNAKNPLIVFDHSNGSINVKSFEKMAGDLNKAANKEALKAVGEQASKDLIEKYGALTTAGLTASAFGYYNADPTKQYKKVR